MFKTSIFLATCFVLISCTNDTQSGENLIIITTDGFRWQEVYRGMDSAIANNRKFNQGDSNYIYDRYWSDDQQERRMKLLPFFWNTLASQGQLYGNRNFQNKVNNANPFWFSYPGYNEIMTGYADTNINSNDYPPNPHVTLLEYLNNLPDYNGKVAAFCAWEAFDRILNEERSGLPVFSSFDTLGGDNPAKSEQLVNAMKQDSYRPFGYTECLDVFTHYGALEWLKSKKPRVLYISYGETDEWAHHGYYRSYLDAAHQVDAWIKQIWEFVQSDPRYKDRTTLFITTDHGRGDLDKNQWTSHGRSVPDAYQIWFAVMGPGISSTGEQKNNVQFYQEQFAQTMAKILGQTYQATHPVSPEIKSVLAK